MSPLDPILAARLRLLDGLTSWPEADAAPELQARADAFWAPTVDYTSPDVDVSMAAALGTSDGDGEPYRVSIRVYQRPSAPAGPRPGLVWVHGGGFTGGDLDMAEADYVARELAQRAGAVVATVDYRLANDRCHYPVPIDDVLSAWRWFADREEEYTLDPGRVYIGGGSAGANLAAAAALRLRDAGEPLPAAVLLAYPLVHPRLPSPSQELAEKLRQVADASELIRFTEAGVEGMCERYTGVPIGETDGYAMPGLAPLSGFPPTLVLNSEYDTLRSSGERFAEQLAAASVRVRCTYEPDVLHGHLNIIGLAGGARSLETLAAVMASGDVHTAPDPSATGQPPGEKSASGR